MDSEFWILSFMPTRKLVIVIASIASGVMLLGVLVAGVVIGIIFYSIGHSEAAATAKNYLSHNEQLKQEIGEVRDFGSIVSGSINSQAGDGMATIRLKVIGERRTVNANVDLVYRNGSRWRVTDASYINDMGQTVELMDKYGPGPSE